MASITASEDGRLWTYGSTTGLSTGAYTFPGGFTNNRIIFKSPGPIDQNYAGPWGVFRFNTLSISLCYPVWKAIPFYGLTKQHKLSFMMISIKLYMLYLMLLTLSYHKIVKFI